MLENSLQLKDMSTSVTFWHLVSYIAALIADEQLVQLIRDADQALLILSVGRACLTRSVGRMWLMWGTGHP